MQRILITYTEEEGNGHRTLTTDRPKYKLTTVDLQSDGLGSSCLTSYIQITTYFRVG